MPKTLRECVEVAQTIARETVQHESAAVDREARWPERNLRALQAELGGLVVPAASGGLGQGLLAVAQVCEALGRACGSTAICFGMHCVGTAVIAAKATADQQERYLAPIARGEHLTTLSLSEPGTGAHFYLPETRLAVESPETFRVNGTKSFVTNGGYADSYVMSTTAAEPDAPPGQFSCIVVPGDSPGLHWSPPWNGWGMRGNSARSVELRDLALSRRDLLGEQGDQIWYVFNVVAPFFLVAMSGTYLGITSAALEAARSHLGERRYAHTAGSISQLPVLQHRLGRLWGQVERTRRLIYHAAAEGDAGGAEALLALCAAKADVAECAERVTNDVMTLLGGRGYAVDAPIHRYLRDARAAHVMAPTTDMLWTWVGRALLGLPLLGD